MKRKYGYWILSCALVAVGCFAGYEYSRAKRLENAVGNSYNRAFFELSDYVDDINSLLLKSLAVNSPSHFAAVSAELSRQAAAAKECISQLPLADISLEKTGKFLSQVGDYSFYLSKNALNDKTMTEEEYNTLSELGRYAGNLSAALNSIQEGIYSGEVDFAKAASDSVETVAYAAGESLDGFSDIEKEFGEYPSLIYDGPFSEHIENRVPAMCDGAKEITPEEAAVIANEFFGRRSGFISYRGISENSKLDSYTFTTKDDETVISITKKGGYILYFLNTRDVKEHTIDYNEAIVRAKEFLNAHGYLNMTESYYEKHDGVATVNFAYMQDGVTCYPDLVKVKVALDDGEIVGLETHGYLMNHTIRDIKPATVSRQEAREKVSRHLSVDSVKLAVIPKDSEREVVCYEFKCSTQGKNYLVYINATDGREEEVMMLIESEEGILTV